MPSISFSSTRSGTTASLITVAGICAGAILATQRMLRKIEREKFDLSGKIVLITGGSRGFGLALAQEFGALGARLALCARDAAELEKACKMLAEKGIEAQPFTADVTKPDQINELVKAVVQHFGRIDVLINDAGLIKVGPFESFTKSDYEEAMDLMFWAPVNLTYAVLPHMQARGSGRIVNITSVGGRVSIPHLLPYSCAKFAMVGFSTGLSSGLREKGIDVLTVVPGLMRTGSYLNAEFTGKTKQEFTWFGLLGNLPGFSVAAEFAAQSVREALEKGEQVCTISFPARVLIALEALAPEVNRALLDLASRFLLPSSSEKQAHSGKMVAPSTNMLFQGLTALGKLAASRLNEL